MIKHRVSRLRRIAGIPSGLALAALATFYLLVNAVTYESAEVGGAVVVWGVTAVGVAVTGLLFARWGRSVAPVLGAALDQPGSSRLAQRRGVVVLERSRNQHRGASAYQSCTTRRLSLCRNSEYARSGYARLGTAQKRVQPLDGRGRFCGAGPIND
jgi:hypothetical protein